MFLHSNCRGLSGGERSMARGGLFLRVFSKYLEKLIYSARLNTQRCIFVPKFYLIDHSSAKYFPKFYCSLRYNIKLSFVMIPTNFLFYLFFAIFFDQLQKTSHCCTVHHCKVHTPPMYGHTEFSKKCISEKTSEYCLNLVV